MEGNAREDELHILQMLQDGLIDAKEAETLLDAIIAKESDNKQSDHGSAQANAVEGNSIEPVAPDIAKSRRSSRVIQLLVVGSLLISSVGLAFMYQAVEQIVLIGFLCVWSIFGVSLLTAFILVLTRSAPWVHLRIQRLEGRNMSVSFPVPIVVAAWGIKMARPFVTKQLGAKLDIASAYIEATNVNPSPQPIVVNIDRGDRASIQIILG
jgi:hypothetical protein